MSLLEYWKVFQHRWALVVACVLVAAGAVWLITPATPDAASRVGSYSATSTLLVGQGPNRAPGSGQGATLGRVQLFVTTGEIPRRAARSLGYEGNPSVLASGLTVAEVENAQAITITSVGSDGERAAQVANTFAEESVRYFEEEHQGTGNARLTVLQEATPIPNATSSALRLPSGRIPRTAIGAVLGLLVGYALALIMDRLDSRLRTRQEVHDALTLPVIAQVPRLKRAERMAGRIPVVEEPLGEYANGYRAARTALMHLPGQHISGEWTPQRATEADAAEFEPARVVLVTSAFASEGKTTSVANLAASFAETGQSVLVLDCDLRSPDAHTQFDVPQGTGISDHLVRATHDSIRPLIRPTNVPGVHIMTAGTRLDHPAALASRLGPIVEEARKLADIILVDTAPLLAASDLFDVLPLVDTVLLVVRSGRLTEQAGNRVAELLGRFQVPVTGAVLVGATVRRTEGYGSAYSYGYGDEPKKRGKKGKRTPRGTAPTVSADGAEDSASTPPTEDTGATEPKAPDANGPGAGEAAAKPSTAAEQANPGSSEDAQPDGSAQTKKPPRDRGEAGPTGASDADSS
ncbi:MAG: hypothetical protein Q4F67_06565 [Propionibacteriaceae bacterium]|nr:hypothetical protein [Propionibacteriaceae bacterium]